MGVRWLACLLLVAGACSSGDGGHAGTDAGRDAAAGRDSGADLHDAGLDGALADASLDAAVDAALDSGPPILGREDMAGLVLNGTIPPADVPAPDFTATAHTGEARTRADLLGHRTVMWFYPAAYTGGWTVEGCGYRDLYDAFTELGVQIVGVSFDDYETNAGFHDLNAMQFELWSDDAQHTLATTYGAGNADSAAAARVTKLLNENGDLIVEYVSAIDVGTHPALVLQDARTIWPQQ